MSLVGIKMVFSQQLYQNYVFKNCSWYILRFNINDDRFIKIVQIKLIGLDIKMFNDNIF